MLKTPSIMTYLLDSNGEKVKVYDLHTVFYPEYAHYDKAGKWIPQTHDCRPFGCECGAPQGMQIPFDDAKEAFVSMRKEMRFYIEEMAKLYGDTDELIIVQREFEPRRLDMLGYTAQRLYKTRLTTPSKIHRLGQGRFESYLIPDGVGYLGNGTIVKV